MPKHWVEEFNADTPDKEWERLRTIGPFRQAGGVLPDRRFATTVVEKVDGWVVGTWTATVIVLLEGLWRDVGVRGRISARHLLHGMITHLKLRKAKTAITYIEDPAVATMAESCGFTKLPGAVYIWELKE
jgi:hypothetical protein